MKKKTEKEVSEAVLDSHNTSLSFIAASIDLLISEGTKKSDKIKNYRKLVSTYYGLAEFFEKKANDLLL